MRRSNDFTFTSTQFVLFQCYFRQCCQRNLASSCLHALDSGTLHVIPGSGTYRKSRLLRYSLARPGHCRTFVFLGLHAEISGWECGQQRLAPHCAQVCRDRWTLQNFSSSRDHARPPRSSSALSVVLTMNARRFQRTHLLSGMGSSLNASKGIGTRGTDIALAYGSEPVAGSARTGRELDAGSDREDRSSGGDTR